MKGFDFTQNGGFPLTQNVLGYLQEGYTEAVQALAAVGGNISGPMVVSGMAVTEPTPGAVAVTSGWFMYNSDLIHFTGGAVTPGVGEVALVLITVSALPLTFYDGSIPDVQLNKTATLIAAPTLTDATHFPVADMMPFGRERDWTAYTDSFILPVYADVEMWYKKDFITNTLLLRGVMYCNNPWNATGLPSPTYYEMLTMPVGYRPANVVPFMMQNNSLSIGRDGDTEIDYILHVNAKLLPDGKLMVEWISTSLPYNVFFNVRLSLD